MSDPFKSDAFESDYAYRPPVEVSSKARPGLLTTICVLAIILGVLGLLMAFMNFGGLLASEAIQQMVTPAGPQPGMPAELFEAQQDMQRQLNEVTNSFWGFLMVLAVAHFFVAGGLLAGGLRALKMRDAGRTTLLYACVGAIVFEVIRLVVGMVIQIRNIPIMDEYTQRVSESVGGMGATIGSITKVAAVGGMVMGLFMVGLKVFFYFYSVYYLRRPATQALYSGESGPHSGGPFQPDANFPETPNP